MTDAVVEQICSTLSERLHLGDVTPRIVGRFSNLVVAMEPLPIVARIATGTALLRDASTFAKREVDLTRFLVQSGAPVVSPCEASLAGPHDVDGWIVTLWQFVEVLSEPPDAMEAGRRLAACHRTLRGYEGEVPRLGFFSELDQLLASPEVRRASSAEDRAFVMRRLGDCRRDLEASSAKFQPVHGDAHQKNVFNTRQGLLWADWEDAVSGPIEWDLACLVTAGRIGGEGDDWAETALSAYGRYNSSVLEVCLRARALFGIGWLWLLVQDPMQTEERILKRRQQLAIWLGWLHGL